MDIKKPSLALSASVFIVLLSGLIVLQRYLTMRFESSSMNFVRYTVGAIGFWIMILIRTRTKKIPKRKRFHDIILLVFISMLLFGNMYFFLMGLSRTNAVTGTLFRILAIPLSAGFATFLIPSERGYVKRNLFIIGMIVAISGSLGYILVSDSARVSNIFRLGGFYLFLSVLLYSFQNILVKLVESDITTVELSAVTASVAAFLFFITAFLKNKLSEIFLASPQDIGLLVLSGIFGLAIGMGIGFAFIRRFGVTIHNLVNLTLPFATGIMGYFILKETMSLPHVILGFVVLIGCSISILSYTNTYRNLPDPPTTSYK